MKILFLCSLLQSMVDDYRPASDAKLDAYENMEIKSRLLSETKPNHYGTSDSGSQNATLKMSHDILRYQIWEFIQNDMDKRSLCLSNRALDIYQFFVDASFQKVFGSLLTPELQRKLKQTSSIYRRSVDHMVIPRRVLSILENVKYIRGIDKSNRLFIIFSLSPSSAIDSHFKQRQNILITFNETNIYSSTHQLTINEFIHLLEYDKVMTALGIVNGSKREWIHYSDLITKRQRMARIRSIIFGFRHIMGFILMSAQFVRVVGYTKVGDDSIYSIISIIASTSIGVLFGFMFGYGADVVADDDGTNFYSFCRYLHGAVFAIFCGFMCYGIASNSVGFNGMASGLLVGALWHTMVSCFELQLPHS